MTREIKHDKEGYPIFFDKTERPLREGFYIDKHFRFVLVQKSMWEGKIPYWSRNNCMGSFKTFNTRQEDFKDLSPLELSEAKNMANARDEWFKQAVYNLEHVLVS